MTKDAPTPNDRKNLLQKILTGKGPVDSLTRIEVPTPASVPKTEFVHVKGLVPEPTETPAPLPIEVPTEAPAIEDISEKKENPVEEEIESIPINSNTRKHIASIIQESMGQWYGKELSDDDIWKLTQDPILAAKLDVLLNTPDRNQPELPDGETRQVIGILASALLLLEVEWKENDKLGSYAIGRIVQPDGYTEENAKRIKQLSSFMGTQNRMFPGTPFARETSHIYFSQQWDTDAIFEFVTVIFNRLNPAIDSPHTFDKLRLPQLITKIQQIQEAMPLHSEEADSLMDRITILLVPPNQPVLEV